MVLLITAVKPRVHFTGRVSLFCPHLDLDHPNVERAYTILGFKAVWKWVNSVRG